MSHYYNFKDMDKWTEEQKKRKGCCPDCIEKKKKFVKVKTDKLTEHSSIIIHYCPECGYVTEWWLQLQYFDKKKLERTANCRRD